MTQDNLSKTYIEKIRTYIKHNELCEISLKTGEIHNGKITEVGDDFVTFVSTIEKESFQISVGEDGKKEKVKSIERIEMETTLKIMDIDAISRILKRVVR